MGSVTKAAGGVAAAVLIQAGMTGAPTVANAQPGVTVPCSTSELVTAITNANGADHRVLRLSPFCDYTLTDPSVTDAANGPDGLPVITGNITLVGGPSTRISRVTSALAFRLLEVGQGAVLRVRNVFLTGGDAGTSTGGAIRNGGGTVELSHATVTGNRAISGGGLDNVGPGRFVVEASLVSGNTAAADGGGMLNDGTLTLRLSRVSRNNAAAAQGGGLSNTGTGQATVFRTMIDRNTAGTDGGGIANGAGAGLHLVRTLIVRDTAAGGGGVFNAPGGTVTRRRSVIRHNIPNDCVGC